MAVSGPDLVHFVVGGPLRRADLTGLYDRVCALLETSSGKTVVCDVSGVQADAVSADALARLQLGARRHRCQVRLRNPSNELLELLDFMGLSDVLTE